MCLYVLVVLIRIIAIRKPGHLKSMQTNNLLVVHPLLGSHNANDLIARD